MFYLTKDKMQIKIHKRVEKHGDEEVNAYDAKLSGDFPNAVLLKLHPDLRGVFYAPDKQQDIEQDYYPNLRFDQMGPVSWALEMSRMEFVVHDEEYPQDDVILKGKEVKDFKFTMKEGGTVTLSLRVVLGQLEEPDLIQLLRVDNHRVPISLAQAEEEAKPDNFEQVDLLGSDPATHSDARREAERAFSGAVTHPDEIPTGLEPDPAPQ